MLISTESINFLLADKRRLSHDSLSVLQAWLEAQSHDSPVGLVGYALRRYLRDLEVASSFQCKANVASDLIDWIRGIFRQAKLVGQTIDYTSWPLGRRTHHGYKIGICPFCGRNGALLDAPGYPQETWHVLRITHQLTSRILDRCNWGDRWYDNPIEDVGNWIDPSWNTSLADE
jgi:hypothetical protein